MKNALSGVIALASLGLAVTAMAGGHSAEVPEISAGMAPLAIGIAVGAYVLYREWNKRK